MRYQKRPNESRYPNEDQDLWSYDETQMDEELIDDICICIIAFGVIATVIFAISAWLS